MTATGRFHSAASGDDFLVPSNVDLSESCDSNSDILGNTVMLPLGGCLSVICYVYLLWMYYVVKSPVLMRHPTTLAIYKCILDLIFVQQYLWLPFVTTSIFYNDDIVDTPMYCNSSWESGLLAFCTQFFLLGGELCFLIISLDLRMAYTNPFTSFEANKWYFGAFVFIASSVTALALIAMGPRVYGLASEGSVWIQDRRSDQSPNYPKMILFYCIIFCIYLYCIWANFQYDRTVEKGFSKTVSNRISIMERSKRYTLAYITYNTVTLVLEFLSFLDIDDSSILNSLPAYFYSCRGIGTLLIILYSNKNDITWENMNPFNVNQRTSNDAQNLALEDLLLQPHLNIALRVELLYFTTLGIMHAARDVEEDDDRVHKPMTDVIGDGSRCYSFDEHPSCGLRPSAVEDFSGRTVSRRPESIVGAELTVPTSGPVPTSRATLAGLEKLEELQNKAVTLAVEAALLDQAEAKRFHLGNQTSVSALIEQTRLSISRPSSARPSDSGGGAGTASSAPSAGAPIQPTQTMGTYLSKHVPEEKQRSPSSMDVEGEAANPMYSSDRRTSAISERMDTTDVEFSMMTERHVASTDSHHWTRVDGVKKPSEVDTMRDGQSVHQTSKSSTTGMLREMLHSAIANATIAAKNVFTPAHKEFRFKDFCPKLFAAVRAMHNISAAEYAKSFETTCRERFSEGRSGAFMFYSSDQRCIVKTTTKEESLALQGIMPAFVKYLESNPASLLVRFLGSHCITMYGVEIYFVVMLNFFPDSALSERYDLKGSWVNRHGMNGKPRTHTERIRSQHLQLAPLYQDNDLQHKISLDSEVAKAISDQIQRDIIFLRDLNRMDYSLLIGVKRERFEVLSNRGDIECRDSSMAPAMSMDSSRRMDSMSSFSRRRRNWYISNVDGHQDPFHRDTDGGVRAKVVEGPGIYYFGIIDVLQAWNWQKRLERFFKMYIRFEDGNGLSAINSRAYADRFFKRCVIDAFEGTDEMDLLPTWIKASMDMDGVKQSVDTDQMATSNTSNSSGMRQVRPIKSV